MNPTIDTALQSAFTPDAVVRAFFDYKLSKWDRFSSLANPTVNVPMGADGITYEGFEKQLYRHAKNISSRVTAGKYVFYPFREVDKRKKPDRPLSDDNKRTLGIASIRDALVQSILYSEVLYDSVDPLFRELDLLGPVSFAYRKGKSAPLAAKQIARYIREGYIHACDFDLRKFFDRIPHFQLLHRVADVIGGTDSITYRLIRKYVRVDRVPHDTYRHAQRKRDKKYLGAKIFHNQKPKTRKPKPDRGVPQGGILSGMLANLYLHEFDKWVIHDLGHIHDLKYLRYADDFIILVKDRKLLPEIKMLVGEILCSKQFDLEVNEGKTQILNIESDGLDFVGFHFDGHHIRARQANVDKFKMRLDETLDKVFYSIDPGWSDTKSLEIIRQRINYKIEGFGKEYKCPRCRCMKLDAPRNWAAFYSVITDDRQLHQLDKWIRRRIYSFMYYKYKRRLSRKNLKAAGLKSLVAQKYRVRGASIRPCLCDIKAVDNDIWVYAEDLYQGRKFFTLVRNCPFYIPHVNADELQVSVGGRQYQISKITLQGLWNRLLSGEVLTRKLIESDGVRNASHIVALLHELPGVEVLRKPSISLHFQPGSPASFLQFVIA